MKKTTSNTWLPTSSIGSIQESIAKQIAKDIEPRWEWTGSRWRRYKDTKTLRPSSRLKRTLIKLRLTKPPTRTVYEYKEKLDEGDRISIFSNLPKGMSIKIDTPKVKSKKETK